LTAIAAGTSFGMFALGMLFPVANGKVHLLQSLETESDLVIFQGALCGAIVASILVGWLSLGAHFASVNGFQRPMLNVTTAGCNSTIGTPPPPSE
jgi:hypothetical protein